MFQPYNFHLFKVKLCWAKNQIPSFMVISEVKSKAHPQFVVAVNYPVGIQVDRQSTDIISVFKSLEFSIKENQNHFFYLP